MSEHLHDMKPLTGVAYGVAATGVIALLTVFASFTPLRRAEALPAYAQQTGLACGRCHVNPAGGGPRTAFGNAFLKNGHKVPSGGKTTKPKGAGKGSGTTAAPAAPPVVVYDYARAGAWSLQDPYYSHFLYSSDDYRN